MVAPLLHRKDAPLHDGRPSKGGSGSLAVFQNAPAVVLLLGHPIYGFALVCNAIPPHGSRSWNRDGSSVRAGLQGTHHWGDFPAKVERQRKEAVSEMLANKREQHPEKLLQKKAHLNKSICSLSLACQ